MRNLLVVVSDEHRFDAIGCANHQFVWTTSLDELANRNLRFNKAVPL